MFKEWLQIWIIQSRYEHPLDIQTLLSALHCPGVQDTNCDSVIKRLQLQWERYQIRRGQNEFKC